MYKKHIVIVIDRRPRRNDWESQSTHICFVVEALAWFVGEEPKHPQRNAFQKARHLDHQGECTVLATCAAEIKSMLPCTTMSVYCDEAMPTCENDGQICSHLLQIFTFTRI